MDIASIDFVQTGIFSKVFDRHYYFARDFKDGAFSMLYENGKKSLDVIAAHSTDFHVWTKGLQALVAAMNNRVEPPEAIPVALPIRYTRFKMVSDGGKSDVRSRGDITVALMNENAGNGFGGQAGASFVYSHGDGKVC